MMDKNTCLRAMFVTRLTAPLFLAAVILATSAQAQMGDMTRGEPEQRFPFLFYEPVNMIASDTSLTRLDIPYRIDQSFFIPVRNTDTSLHGGFVFRGEILIELFDSVDVSKARSIQSIEIGTDNPEREQPGRKWYKGIATFEIPPGPYKIVVDIDDLESDRHYVDDKTTLRLRRLTAPPELSTPFFFQWKAGNDSSHTFEPVDFGPNLLFGQRAALYVELPLPREGGTGLRTEYSISTSPSADRPGTVALAETLASPHIIPRVRLESVRSSNTAEYRVSSSDSSRAVGIIVPLASEKLLLRRFDLSLTIQQGAMTYRTSKKFQMVWPDMPSSLRDIDYAINSLKYITTEGQRDSLSRGSLEERRDKLEAFWAGKNDKPGTAYNEIMVEYYRRVDYASRNFGTLRDPDGFKSDRGRVYILYGPPTKTERTLSPAAGYQEVWVYERLGKKFVFADQSKSGNYVLISTQPL